MRYLQVVLILSISFCAFAQCNPSINEIDDASLVKLLNSVTLEEESKGSEIFVRIFTQTGIPASAGYQNGEVLLNVYITVSEYDEFPDQKLFVLSGIKNLRDITIEDFNNHQMIKINTGGNGNDIELKVSIEEIKIINKASS